MTVMSPLQLIKSAKAFGKYKGVLEENALSEYVPARNAMQAKFLDKDFCLKTIALARYPFMLEDNWCLKKDLETILDFEFCGWDVAIGLKSEAVWHPEDTELVLTSGYVGCQALIELMPTIGDEYPLILRDMKENLVRAMATTRDDDFCPVLVYDKFTGEGVTEEELIGIFEACGFKALSMASIEAVATIDFDAHMAVCVGSNVTDKGVQKDKKYFIDIPCRCGGTVHLVTTLGTKPLSVSFDDERCQDCCHLCHELSSYTLLRTGDCCKE